MDPIGQDVLSKLKSYHPMYENAVIAGGFVRDHILGGAFKDIDVFYPAKSNNKQDSINDFFDSLDNISNEQFKKDFEFDAIIGTEVDQNYDGAKGLVSVVQLKYQKTIPVQLMAYNLEIENNESFAQSLLKTFDFDICKLYFNGDDLFVSKEAERDIETYTATLSYAKDQNSFMKSIQRYHRWKDRYPDLKFKTPYQFFSEKDLKQRDEYYLKRIEELEQIIYKNKLKMGNIHNYKDFYYKDGLDGPQQNIKEWIAGQFLQGNPG